MTEVRAFADFSGRRADGELVRGLIPQLDGTSRQGDNCAAASEADRAIRNQQGKRPAKGSPWQPTGASIRAASTDRSGGMTPRETTDVTERVYGIPNDVRIVPFATVDEWLRKGGSVTLLYGYGPIADAGMSGSPGFRGSHSGGAAGIRSTGTALDWFMADSLYDGRRTGIPRGPQWISRRVIQEAAGELVVGAVQPGVLIKMRQAHPGMAYCSFGTRVFTPPPTGSPFVRYPGATHLKKARLYTPIYRNSALRRKPERVASSLIAPVQPGVFHFSAYQLLTNAAGKWVGNKNGTAWMFAAGVKFVRYL